MAINFPNNPQANQVYTEGNRSWKWNGRYWAAVSTTIGYTGSQGDLGYTGSAGQDGIIGQDGYTGSQGDTGFVGSQGELGYTGSAGQDGIIGQDGYTGSQGDVGYTGSKGDTGLGFRIAKSYSSVAALLADTSPTGIIAGEFAIIETGDVEDPENSRLYIWTGSAYTYVSDLSGAAGITGPQGNQGYTGSAGQDGIIGQDGYTGSQGDTGFVGSQGDIGYTGSAGQDGYTGSQGDIGYTGSAGQDGITGQDGYTGSQGDVGYTGSAGQDGIIGQDGYTGSQGDVGYTGSAGQDGADGYTGSSGASTFSYGNTAPVSATLGDRWFDTDESILYIYVSDGNSEFWLDISSSIAGPAGYTGSIGAIGPSGYTGSRGESSFTWGNVAPVSPAMGDRWFDTDRNALVVYVDDGDSQQWVEVSSPGLLGYTGSAGAGADFSSIDADLIPSANITYDLGTPTLRWRDLYLSGNTIDLGGATIKSDADTGTILLIPPITEDEPEPSAVVFTKKGGFKNIRLTNGQIPTADLEEIQSNSNQVFSNVHIEGALTVGNITVAGTIAGYATTNYVDTELSNLVDSAPGALDTLNELAAALGDDANFATTVTNLIGNNTTNITALQSNVTALDSQIANLNYYDDNDVATFLSDIGSNAVTTTGNVTAGYFIGDGSQLTGLESASVNVSETAPVSPADGDMWLDSTTGNFSVYVGGGWLKIGPSTGSGSSSSSVSQSNATFTGQYLKIPSGTTEQRPSSPAVGMIRFNTSTDSFEFYASVGWLSVGGLSVSSVTPNSFNGEQGTVFTVTGTGFVAGSQAAFITANSSIYNAGVTTVIDSSTITATTPRDFTVADGPLGIRISTPAGGSVSLPSAISTGNNPIWSTTAGNIGAVSRGSNFDIQLSATDPDDGATIEYSIVSGSLLAGLTLDTATGNVSGTYSASVTPVDGGTSVATFTVRATDNAGNYNDREFSITGLNDYITQAFTYTGAQESYIFPNGVTSALIKAWGAGGANLGGGGGYATGTMAVTAGETYNIIVGGTGSDNTPGFGGGGLGGNGNNTDNGGGGGGYSGIFLGAVSQANAQLIAGGGGGGVVVRNWRGGVGGGTSGTRGAYGNYLSRIEGGAGGTQEAGGGAGQTYDGNSIAPTAGSGLQAGRGGTASSNGHTGGGGGGGGYYGGGGGAGGGSSGGAGGGGSGYINTSTITNGTLTAGSAGTAGNSSDSDRLSNAGNAGVSGLLLIKY